MGDYFTRVILRAAKASAASGTQAILTDIASDPEVASAIAFVTPEQAYALIEERL